MDIVVVNQCWGGCSGALSVLLGNGDGTFKPAVAYPTGPNPFSLAVGDFKGDGKLDLAVTSDCNPTCGGFASIYLGNGDGTFQAKVDYTVGSSPSELIAVDLNNDGKLDIAVTVTASTAGVVSSYDAVVILLGKAMGHFSQR